MNIELIKELDKILPVVARVHGDNHPELQQVVTCYEAIKENPSKEGFEKLREVTQNYKIPEDACPTYTKAYQNLAALDREFA